MFASEDNAATPTEIVLAALASCLTGGIASVATRRGVKLHSVTATLEADIEAIVAQSQKRSAVFDVVANPTTIQVEVV